MVLLARGDFREEVVKYMLYEKDKDKDFMVLLARGVFREAVVYYRSIPPYYGETERYDP